MFNADYARSLVKCGVQNKMRKPEELLGFMVAMAALKGENYIKLYSGTRQYFYVVNNEEELKRMGYSLNIYGNQFSPQICAIVRW